LGLRILAALVLLPCCFWGQDERRVVSPDGQLEFRIFVSQSERGGLSRLAYRILRHGKPLIETSFLGLNIHNQEPFLGENVGLIGSRTSEAGGARGLTAEYMQNGSIGRLINVEARVWNEGVAFRYVVPRSTALEEILIDDELTEFDVGREFRRTQAALPLTVGPLRISEVARAPYPRVSSLTGRGDGVLRTQLARATPDAVTAFEGQSPLTGPWRVVTLGDSAVPRELR
jgi:hypothetical protein